jgi:hypothetical protein
MKTVRMSPVGVGSEGKKALSRDEDALCERCGKAGTVR